MLFLIEYDRDRGQVVTIQEFDGSNRAAAEAARLDMEVRFRRSETDREVVILEAKSIAALKQTHGRYFQDLSELVNTS